ncbi:MAG: hypothetical protein Q8M20_06735 [Rhodocyclaceae bacterium]|nr:hypothetical protein [Rhodocyclaceae bacterium]MDZ4214404.1 hypothetical protein [Rhodocyclaceae bacterium]
MGYEITWIHASSVIKRHFGNVIGSELMAAVAETESDPRFDTLRYVINDFRDCVSLTVSTEEIEEISAIDYAAAASNPNILIAVVATLPDVVAAANAYANDPLAAYKTRVFSSMDEARLWLGLPAE